MYFASFVFQPTPPVWAETLKPAHPLLAIRFQPTPPVWAETPPRQECISGRRDFNPLRPCGRRRQSSFLLPLCLQISTHSARVGGDVLIIGGIILIHHFNPLRPCGRRRSSGIRSDHSPPISTHSARVGGDWKPSGWQKSEMHFNPLRPCGRRRHGGRVVVV